MDVPIEELRRDPSPIATLGLTEIVDHYQSIICDVDSPPIIMGHSFGGLVTQILLDRGLGAAGVAIGAAPAKGILFLPFSTRKISALALINPANIHRAVPLTPEQVPLRLHEHSERRGIASGVQQLRCARTRPRAVPGRVCEL